MKNTKNIIKRINPFKLARLLLLLLVVLLIPIYSIINIVSNLNSQQDSDMTPQTLATDEDFTIYIGSSVGLDYETEFFASSDRLGASGVISSDFIDEGEELIINGFASLENGEIESYYETLDSIDSSVVIPFEDVDMLHIATSSNREIGWVSFYNVRSISY